MRIILAGFAVLGIAVIASHALDGKNGYGATALFTAGDIVTEVTPFSGVEWGDLDSFHLGISGKDNVAVASDGTIYVLVGASDQSANAAYTGIVESDGQGFRNLVQDVKVSDGSGRFIRGVVVSPVTASGLTKDHLVLWRSSRATATAQTYLEIWSMDPSDGTETLLHSWPSAVNPRGVLVVDGGGNLYFLSQGLEDGSGGSLDGTIRKLVWNGSSFDESSLTALRAGTSLALGSDGALYTLSEDTPIDILVPVGESTDIFRVDPATGASTVHATVAANHFFDRWTWDSDGAFWIALRETQGPAKKRIRYVTQVNAGRTTSKRDRIAEYGAWGLGDLAAGPAGELYALERDGADGLNDTLYRLSPGDSDGGGNGGGKGKPKK